MAGLVVGCGDPDSAGEGSEDALGETQGDEAGSDELGDDGPQGEDGGGGDGQGDEQGDEGEGEPSCAEQPGPWDAGYALTRADTPAGDPALGLSILLEEDYVACGIPLSLFGIAQTFLGKYTQGESLDWRAGKNADVPYSWNVITFEDGSEMVAPNCFNCHGAQLDGELVLGLGRTDVDFTQDMGTALALMPTFPPLTEAGVAFNKMIERFEVISPPAQMRTIGTNPAIMYALVLVNHRNPLTLAWLDEPMAELPPEMILPGDPPPWWRVKKKAAHFANGMSRGDHRGTMILASSVCTDTTAEASVILDDFVHVNAYIESLEAPLWQDFSGPAIDQALAERGREVFECSCAGCHGTYDEDPEVETYPNLLIPLDVIGTDSAMAAYAADQLGYLTQWFNASYYGLVTDLVTKDPFAGYVAPPLDGVWATAPYFHNGSVPTLAAVLDSSARPRYWRRVDDDSTHYDWSALGWIHEVLDYGQSEAALDERTSIYDTDLFGHGNEGHAFGDSLSAEDRAAVIEYIKTI
ncbi:hypothetical protein G6O69_31715 [Pseudenhygromyxa sp. WMMC2535]|uniref:c-type cytochrome n=1 Tax=Pseudenhygromyxa sp. WMMC2535 TaxID=2712867 RepID=UPI0015565E46|nr:hypothetical protein [Pseudenhygromyxa sp. WMMC2535]NVB42434.1 hypothetical protein [Pseudenhygromyxa sp. WMMC2535]